jgi:hypothetical protein
MLATFMILEVELATKDSSAIAVEGVHGVRRLVSFERRLFLEKFTTVALVWLARCLPDVPSEMTGSSTESSKAIETVNVWK